MKAKKRGSLGILIATVTLGFGGLGETEAGFDAPGVTPVPITEEGIDKAVLEGFDRRMAQWTAGGQQGPRPTYPPFESVPQERIDVLKTFPPFEGKTDAEIGGFHYPRYQFELTNSPMDVCTPPHWHAFAPVFPLEIPDAGILDPTAPEFRGCGFGIFPFLAPEMIEWPYAEWKQFRSDHP